MATITLTPTAYYQIVNNTVTAIDPATKNVNNNNNTRTVILAHFTIPSDTWAYSVINSQSIKYYTLTYHTAAYITAKFDFQNTTWGGKSTLSVSDSVNRDFLTMGNSYINFAGQSANITTTPNDNKIRYVYGKNLWLEINGGSASFNFTFTSLELTLNYTAVTTPTYSMTPSGGFLNYTVSNTLTLKNTNTQHLVNAFTLTGGTLKYKLSSAPTYSSISFNDNTATIPANTLSSASEYDIYAEFTTTNSLTGSTAEGTYNTEDAAAVASIIAPDNSIESGNVHFIWNYSNAYGSEQYAYDLALSDDGTTYNTVISHEVSPTTNRYYTVSTSGAMYWKVRAYNLDDSAGSWSAPGYFVNNIPPDAPEIISVSGTGRLSVTWAASNQIAYTVKVYDGDNLVYDSGAQYSTIKTHLINEYLPNGAYTIKVSVINSLGQASPEASQVYNITSVGNIDLTYTAEDTITLYYDDTGYSRFYILRNGEIIGVTEESPYNDIYANGTNVYTVIGVKSDDSYDIGTIETDNLVKYTRLVDLEGNIFDISHRFNERIGIGRTDEADADTALFLGAVRPSHTFGKGRVRRYTVMFAYDGDYTQFMAKVVRFMDVYGNSDYVVIPNISASFRYYGNELTANLEVTNYNTGITYAL